jgi:hypothetical protein
MSLSQQTQARLAALRRRGCQVGDPEEAEAGWTCSITLPGGPTVGGSGPAPEHAVIAAVDEAERLTDVVQEASEESFPACHAPG